MTLPQASGHLGNDPRAPRDKDLARAVPAPGADLATLDDAKIFAAPDDPRDWDDWRQQLRRWRDDARVRIGYRGERYEREDIAWTQRCFSVCLAWLWDERLYDRTRQAFTVAAFLEADAGLGGYDAVVLWHTYPLIGIDTRDQFDLYKDVPGLPAVVREFQDRGIHVFMEYQAWDRGTRPERDDAAELATLVRETGVDGIFLDTLREAPAGMREALDSAGKPVVLEGESNIPLARIADHEMSWAQWHADTKTPGVLRAKWFEQRHMLHQTRRWDRDRTPQLRTAWLNGAGMLVWENVFGSLVEWSPLDRAMLAAMLGVQRFFARHLSHGVWTPLADPADLGAPSCWASRFELDGSRLWTIAGRDGRALGPDDAILTDTRGGDRWFELITGRELRPEARGGRSRVALPPSSRPFAAILAMPSTRIGPSLRDLLATQATRRWSDDARSPERPHRRLPVPRAPLTTGPRGMIAIPSGERTLTLRYRLRETGMYGNAPFADLWKPLPPLLHHVEEERHAVTIESVAVARTEVTNADYARFIESTGYRPAIAERFLMDWSDGRPRRGTDDEPVRCIDLDDARAYARWAGQRLPTEFEWQVASRDPAFARGEPLVWNWTESEHTDGRTRYVVLKGGSHVRIEGSEWYADGGPQPADVALKYLRAGPAIERSAAIGFRCAADLDGSRR